MSETEMGNAKESKSSKEIENSTVITGIMFSKLDLGAVQNDIS